MHDGFMPPVAAALPLSATPPTPAKPSASPALSSSPAIDPRVQLAAASRALWSATLSLMVAFMQTAAPEDRLLLAQRIARNLDTLARQDCFDRTCRATFARLAQRWQARSEQLAPQPARRGLLDLLS